MIARREVAWIRRWRTYGRPQTEDDPYLCVVGGPLQRLEGLRLIALLGEPGSGKSTELAAAKTRCATNGRHLTFDLREYASEDRFAREWTDGISAATSVPHELLTVWVDAVDEGLLHVRKLSTLLPALLRKLPAEALNRISLRVACRTGAWPKILEESLELIFYERGGSSRPWVQELQDLDDEDLQLFVDSVGLSERFVDAVVSAGAGVFAARPASLWLLATVFDEHGSLPSSRWQLYERALRHLVLEPNRAQLDDGSLSFPPVEDALDVCGIAAATGLLTGRERLHLGLGDRPDGTLRPTDVFDDEARAHVLEALARHTPLFRRSGPHGFEFAHRTYAEFLAARVMERRCVSDAGVRRAMTGHSGFVAPHLREFAGWAAARRSALWAELVEREPELVLEGDPRDLPRRLQLRAVRRVFERIAGRDVLVRGGEMVQLLHRLPRDVLVESFRDLFSNPVGGVAPGVLYDALVIVGQKHLVELAEDLAAFVIDETADGDDRQSAAGVLLALASDRAHAILPRYLLPREDGTAHPLFVRALAAAGRSELPASEFFSAVECLPDDRIVGGQAWAFIAHDLPDIVTLRGWQAEALRWVTHAMEPRPDDHPWRHPFRTMVWTWASAGLRDAAVHEATLSLLVELGQRHATLPPQAREDVPRPLRRTLLLGLLALPENRGSTLALQSAAWLADSEDLAFLLEYHRNAARPEAKRRAIDVLRRLIDVGDVQQGAVLHEFGDTDAELKASLPWFFGPIDLDSSAAVLHRKQRRAELEHQRKVQALGDRPERVRDALKRSTTHEQRWWNVLHELTLEPDSTDYGGVDRQIEHLPGWQAADSATRSDILLAAHAFLQHARPSVGAGWLKRNEYPPILLVGAAAVFAIASVAPAQLSTLSAESWSYWLPAVLRLGGMLRYGPPTWSIVAGAVPPGALSAVEACGRVIVTADADDGGAGQFLGRVRSHPPFQTPGVPALLTELCGSDALPKRADAACMEALLHLDRTSAIEIAESRLLRGIATDSTVSVSLVAGEQPGWSLAIESMRKDRSLAEQALSSLGARNAPWRVAGDPALAWPDSLPLRQLVDLYDLVVELCPVVAETRTGNDGWMAPVDRIAELRRRLPMVIAALGTAEAVDELQRLAACLNPVGIDISYAVAVARQNFRGRSWRAFSTIDVLVLLGERPGSLDRLRSSREELRAAPPNTQAVALGEKSLHVLVTGFVFAACRYLLEGLSLLPRGAEEDKYTDLLLPHLAGRVEELGWTLDPQSRGGRSWTGVVGSARGGVGERDVVLRQRGVAFALIEALLLPSVDAASMARHLEKLTSERRYNPTGLFDAVMICYSTAPDFEAFWARYTIALIAAAPPARPETSREVVVLDVGSSTMQALEVTYVGGMRVTHIGLAVGAVST